MTRFANSIARLRMTLVTCQCNPYRECERCDGARSTLAKILGRIEQR